MRKMILLLLMLILAEVCVAQDYCGVEYYNDTMGSIHSPGYPTNSYRSNTDCTYRLQALHLSRISLTFQSLDLEFNSNCSYDWVQVGCVSHQTKLPRRYCGHSPPQEAMIVSPCILIVIDFHSDGSANGAGFSISYQVAEIECAGNCTPVSNSYGYDCPCDRNQTNASLPTAPPYPTCPSGCTLYRLLYSDHSFCNCPRTMQSTTFLPCIYPCYYAFDYSSDDTSRIYCQCSRTTTEPPQNGCNQTLTGTYGTITSPNYPNAYTKGIDCLQTILVPMATIIILLLLDMDIFYTNGYSCVYEYIVIIGCDGSSNIYCTTYAFPSTGLVFQCTDSSIVTINFHSSASSYYSYRGFKITYSANLGSNCSDSGLYLADGATGFLTSPNFPNNFPAYSECYNYIFTDDDNIMIKITFEQLRLEQSSNCERVSLRLTCQDDTNSYREVCGMKIPSPLTFDCRVLQIWFKSNTTNPISPRGYKIRYYGKSKQRSTMTAWNWATPTDATERETNLPYSSKIGIGLGVGNGGFFFIILIAIIIVCSKRHAARRDQRHLENLTVICRNINDGRGPDASVSVQFCGGPPPTEGNVTPMHVTHTNPAYYLPTYSSATGSQAESSSVGGYSVDPPRYKLHE